MTTTVLIRKTAVKAVSVAVFIGFSAGVCASEQQTSSNVSCAVVGLRMIQATDPQQSSAGMMLAVYYLGRLDERLSEADSERMIRSEAKKMTSAEFRSAATRCGKALSAKGLQIQRAGAYLSDGAQDGSKK